MREMLILGILAYFLYSGGSSLVNQLTGTLSASQIKMLAASAGFQGDDLNTAVAIALAESGGNASDIGDVNNPVQGAQSYGLWQINSYYHPEYGPNFNALLDPQTNANAAYAIYSASGFGQWTTYNTGAYNSFLSQAQAV